MKVYAVFEQPTFLTYEEPVAMCSTYDVAMAIAYKRSIDSGIAHTVTEYDVLEQVPDDLPESVCIKGIIKKPKSDNETADIFIDGIEPTSSSSYIENGSVSIDSQDDEVINFAYIYKDDENHMIFTKYSKLIEDIRHKVLQVAGEISPN